MKTPQDVKMSLFDGVGGVMSIPCLTPISTFLSRSSRIGAYRPAPGDLLGFYPNV